ncbi:MAG: DUF4175 family protein [Gammaproteobacteria bacterium]
MTTVRIGDIGAKLTSLFRLLVTPWRALDAARPGLADIVDRVRQRWRARLLINGLCWILLSGLAVFAVSAWLLNYWHFSAPAVWSLRMVMLVSAIALLFKFVVQPLRRRVSDTRVALYLEEHEPGLRAIMLSAIDARNSDARDLSPRLVERLVERALDACARIDYGDAIEQRGLRDGLARLGAVLLLLLALSLLQPEFMRFGAKALLMPWTSASEYSPYQIELQPGSVEIARGSDQLISANIAGFDGDGVLLYTSSDDGASWQQVTMTSGSKPGQYEFFLFDLEQPLDYFVEAAGKQTPGFRITVADIPAIEEIGLRYHYPAYTMLAPETTAGSGDITALSGTRVEVLITPTIDIPGGELLLDDGRSIGLLRDADGTWAGEVVVETNASYRVTLQRASGIPVDASPEFRITALDDRHPSVSILSPGKDSKVSMIEEPLMRIQANDDQGIASLELVLSVNGEDQRVVPLLPGAQASIRNQQVDAEHVVFLEDLGLQPGDLISYYVQARDRAPQAQSRTATSDIFFYQVRPFSTDYRNAEQGGGNGGGGGGQGGQQQGHLSEQQKQFVIATFKMIRDRDQYSDEVWRENLEVLATAEARIRDRVEAIVRRIRGRSIVRVDERYQVVLEELPRAASVMVEVEESLAATEIETALADAQVALKHLQRADAAFREINVSLARQRGGGAGNNTGSEDLANLFRLEMDKLRNQYETVQRGQQQQAPEQVIDETLERLAELARRQQQEVERRIRRQGQPESGASDANQLALAEELEEMARQLERLTREQPNSQLQQSISQMRDAAAAMRRAAGSGNGGGSIEQARQAADRLSEAQRLLDQGRLQKFSEEVERTLRQAELVEKKQAVIKREVSELDQQFGQRLEGQLQQIEDRKRELAENLTALEGELSKLTTAARDEQPRASESLKQAIRASRENRLHDRIGRTRTMLQLGEKEHAVANESAIQKGIGQVRENIESALANVGESGKRSMARSLEQMRALARELRFLRERMPGTGAGSGAGDGNGRWPGADFESIRRDLENIAARSGEIGRELLEQGVESGDIDPVLEKIRQLSDPQNAGVETVDSELALDALMALEYKLRQQLEKPEVPELLVSEPAELPPDYAEMIAEYFRNLSRP